MIQLKRAYEKPSPEDGYRVLVERFWPRNLNKEHAKIDLWLKDVAPSEEMHVQFGENPDPERWEEFQKCYWRELRDKHKSIKLLLKKMREGTLTLVHAAHNPEHSGAAVLKRFLEIAEKMPPPPEPPPPAPAAAPPATPPTAGA